MSLMRKAFLFVTASLCALGLIPASRAQNPGSLDFIARITPTGARPEPVRQFTFYVLTKSYAAIVGEVETQNVAVPKDQFIQDLKVSPELKDWMKAHDVLDLTTPGLDKLVTPDDILHVPEFLFAYQRSNSGGVTKGIPHPKYRDADKTENPDRYAKQHDEYLVALKKFIQAHPESVSGIELEFVDSNPQQKWVQIQADHKRRVQRLAPDVAQTKYLAGKVDTDLDGRAVLSGLPAGNYWLSTLSLDAAAGDTRLRWDVPVIIETGRTARVELTNINASDANGGTP
jgi:hypothetical protein